MTTMTKKPQPRSSALRRRRGAPLGRGDAAPVEGVKQAISLSAREGRCRFDFNVDDLPEEQVSGKREGSMGMEGVEGIMEQEGGGG